MARTDTYLADILAQLTDEESDDSLAAILCFLQAAQEVAPAVTLPEVLAAVESALTIRQSTV